MSELTILHATTGRLQTIGRYQVVRRIGRGGMGEVWLCEDPRLKRQVAIKTLPPHTQQNRRFAQRFEREAKAIAALTHPHILPIHDYGKQELPDGSAFTYLVMPYIAGGSLSGRLSFYHRQQQRMPTQEALTWLKQAAEAIDFAHHRQIIHRDIKPANMLLRDDGWLLLADFGIARILSGAERLTRTGQQLGTPEYMAPEQIQGKASIVSDNYSLAVIAYQIFTGRVPFREDTAVATMMLQLTTPPPLPQHFNPTLPTAFVQILLRGLEKDPQLRPALASEFVAQLELAFHNPSYQPIPMRTLQDMPTLSFIEQIATQPVSEQQAAKRKRKSFGFSRRQILFGSGTAAAVLAGGALGTWGIVSSAQGPKIPTPSIITARPRTTGKNLPALLLNGHVGLLNSLYWSGDNQTLLSCGKDGQMLRWNIPQIFQHPTRPYGTPFSNGVLQFRNTYHLSVLAGSPIFGGGSIDDTLLAIANTTDDRTLNQVSIYTADLRLLRQIDFKKDRLDAGAFETFSWLPGNYLMLEQYVWPVGQDARQQIIHVVDAKQPQRRWIVEQATQANYDDGEALSFILSPYSTTSTTRALVYDKHIAIGTIQINENASWKVQKSISLSIDDKTTFKIADWSADEKSIVGTLTNDANDNIPAFIKDWHEPRPQLARLKPADTNATYTVLACNPASTTAGLAMLTDLGEVFIWDLKENTAPVRKLETGGITGIPRLFLWSPDGRWLVANMDSREANLVVWKL